MKTIKLLSVFAGLLLLNSCTADVVIEEPFIEEEPSITLNELLSTYEIWYIDINQTQGSGEVPFLQKAFTVSFTNGTFFANNNLVGMGSNGNGFGLDVGYYDTLGMRLDIDHDTDGLYSLEVIQLSDTKIKLYDGVSNTSYFLTGYQRNTFDYDSVFYDNIHFFLQEYETWEKTYTSQFGMLNEFDEENYMRFLPFGSGDNFKSSRDVNGTLINSIFYDYLGHYEINDIVNDANKKTLTLDYDYLGNEFFELSVINDNTIELFHPTSGTVYRFVGRGYIQFKNAKTKGSIQNIKKRIKKVDFLKLTQ